LTRVTGLHHVQLAMPPGGEEEARRFYGDVLGLEEVPKPPGLAERGGCWFRGNGLELHLGVEEAFRAARKAHPAFLVEGLDALRAALDEEGVESRDDAPLERVRRFHASDPFGNRLEFLEAEAAGPRGDREG
jgi:catechol 2,3-dioxygenase-like lactoylglutathione lyase family enzyme